MSIHHATLDRATKLGVVVTEKTEDGIPVFTAHWTKRNKRLTGENPKLLIDEMAALIEMATSYRSFKWKEEDDGQKTVSVKLSSGMASATADYLHVAFATVKKDWTDAMAERDDEDGEEEADDEQEDEADDDSEKSGSVVDARYRAKYAEAGHPNHCGDELASILERETVNDAGSNIELFELICSLNGVDTSKYNRTTHGWQGRIRMTGRNLLGPKLYFAGGLLKLPNDRTHQMGDEWMASQRYKATKGKGKKADVLEPGERVIEESTTLDFKVASTVTNDAGDERVVISDEPLVTDRFGVNPPDAMQIEPKGPRKGRKAKAA